MNPGFRVYSKQLLITATTSARDLPMREADGGACDRCTPSTLPEEEEEEATEEDEEEEEE